MGTAIRQTLVSERDYLAAERETYDYSEPCPVLVAEILSPSTASTDRREKRLVYHSLPSLVDYLIVSQDETTFGRFTRDADGWTSTTFGGGERIELPSLGLSLSTDDIYADVPMTGRS